VIIVPGTSIIAEMLLAPKKWMSGLLPRVKVDHHGGHVRDLRGGVHPLDVSTGATPIASRPRA